MPVTTMTAAPMRVRRWPMRPAIHDAAMDPTNALARMMDTMFDSMFAFSFLLMPVKPYFLSGVSALLCPVEARYPHSWKDGMARTPPITPISMP